MLNKYVCSSFNIFRSDYFLTKNVSNTLQVEFSTFVYYFPKRQSFQTEVDDMEFKVDIWDMAGIKSPTQTFSEYRLFTKTLSVKSY